MLEAQMTCDMQPGDRFRTSSGEIVIVHGVRYIVPVPMVPGAHVEHADGAHAFHAQEELASWEFVSRAPRIRSNLPTTYPPGTFRYRWSRRAAERLIDAYRPEGA